MSKFKVGDKIKLPVDKTTTCDFSWEESSVYSELPTGQDFIYVSYIYPHGEVSVGANPDSRASDYREEDLELYEDNLPEKWCIKKTYENYKEIDKWFSVLPQKYIFNYVHKDGYMHYPAYALYKEFNLHAGSNPQKGYTEITLEQFREITKNNTKMEKKILGYKAPYDLFVGTVKAGTIYQPLWKLSSVKVENYCATKDGKITDNSGKTNLPREIVETWEPYYEPEEITLKLGGKNIEVKIGKGYIRADGREFTIEVLRELYNSVRNIPHFLDYDIEVATFKIGCTTTTPGELKGIIDTYNKLNQ